MLLYTIFLFGFLMFQFDCVYIPFSRSVFFLVVCIYCRWWILLNTSVNSFFRLYCKEIEDFCIELISFPFLHSNFILFFSWVSFYFFDLIFSFVIVVFVNVLIETHSSHFSLWMMLVFAMDYFFVLMHILCLWVFCVKMVKTTQRETIKDDFLAIDAFVSLSFQLSNKIIHISLKH